ncbi:hypothetical protein [Martelella endophytica]|uniref:hypothetical protein n=1 Tax=Martelella endophytica TaxID=1486262 RepID=UPI001184D606|nr:hypothetical protein [Martelella endophytica]
MEDDIFGWTLEKISAVKPCLRQGDLIVFSDYEDETKRCAIVVTADCDLEQKKHANLVTLVPVVSEKTILERYLLPDDCNSKIDHIVKFALKEYKIDEKLDHLVQVELLIEALSSDAKSDPIALLMAEIISDDLREVSIEGYKDLLKRVKLHAKKASSLADQIAKRGDLMILPDAQVLGVDARIAWVRHVWQAPASSIALKTSDTSARRGERIARLSSPFRYRLTQIMAQVFSDIGLPDVPLDLKKSVMETFGDA